MNIQADKLQLIEWISKLNDSKIIKKLQLLKEEHTKSEDWWKHLKKEELESIKRGLKDIEEGKMHPHKTAKNLYEKYL